MAREVDLALLEGLTANGAAGWPVVERDWFGTGRSWLLLIANALRFGFALWRSPFELRRARHSSWLNALRAGVIASDP
jgi:hypothetical protein